MVSAETRMFHANPEHTGVYSDGGVSLTNNLKWSYQNGDNVFSSTAVAKGNVYFGSVDNNVYAMDADTGSLVWKIPPGEMSI